MGESDIKYRGKKKKDCAYILGNTPPSGIRVYIRVLHLDFEILPKINFATFLFFVLHYASPDFNVSLLRWSSIQPPKNSF